MIFLYEFESFYIKNKNKYRLKNKNIVKYSKISIRMLI